MTMREKMDISDFNLEAFLKQQTNKLNTIKTNLNIFCIAKHLCGGATDLSLVSILQK